VRLGVLFVLVTGYAGFMAKSEAKNSSIAVRNATTGRYVAKKTAKQSVSTVRGAATVSGGGDRVKSVAARVAGSKAAAETWYAKSNDLLGGRTPKQAVQDGDTDRVVGLLLNVAGQ
jgi:hypothetical protein